MIELYLREEEIIIDCDSHTLQNVSACHATRLEVVRTADLRLCTGV